MGRWTLLGSVCAAVLLVALALRGPAEGAALSDLAPRAADGSASADEAVGTGEVALSLTDAQDERRAAVSVEEEGPTEGTPEVAAAREASGVAIDGRVLDPDGQPVEGASIVAHAHMVLHSEARVVAQTGPDGRFSLRGVSSDTAIGARKVGWAPSSRIAPRIVAARELEFDLRFTEPGGTLRGIVVDPGGKPVASALVEVVERGPRKGGPHPPSGAERPGVPRGCSFLRDPAPVRLRTDEDGTFELPGARPGVVRLRASARDLVRSGIRCEVEPGEVTSVRVELVHGATLEGRAQRPDGSPATDARVALRVPGDSGRSQPVDPVDGTFRIRGLPAGEGDAWLYGSGLGSAREKVTLVEGRATRWDPVAEDLVPLDGTVVAETGEPLEGWIVRARRGSRISHRASTDGSGRFSLEGVLRSTERLELVVPRSALFHAYVAATVDPWSLPRPLRIVVPIGQIPSATVRFSIDRAAAEGAETRHARFTRRGDEGDVDALFGIGSDGSCATENLPPGRYDVRVELDESVAFATRIELAAAEDLDLGPLLLAPRGEVELRVTCPRPETFDYGVSCELLDASGIRIDWFEISSPTVSLGPLPQGSYRLVGDDFEVARFELEFAVVANETRTVELDLVPATYRDFWLFATPPGLLVGVITTRLLDAEGAEIRSDSFEWNAAIGDEGLPLEEVSLVTGRYVLEVRDDVGRTARAAFEIETADHPTEDAPPISLTLRRN